MTLAANLKTAFDALTGAGLTVYYAEQLAKSGSNVLTTAPENYCDVALVTDSSSRAFGGEAYTDTRIKVRAWSTNQSASFDNDTTAKTALEASGWTRIVTTPLPFDSGYWGVASDYHKPN